VIEKLAWLGYRTCPESSRILIDDHLSKKSLIDFSTVEFEAKLFEEKISAEAKFNINEIVFWDRCPIDSIAFSYLYKRNLENKFFSRLKFAYRYVFCMCELEEYKYDYATLETEENAVLLENLLFKSYTQLGYKLIKVADMDISSRVDFILEHIGLLGK